VLQQKLTLKRKINDTTLILQEQPYNGQPISLPKNLRSAANFDRYELNLKNETGSIKRLLENTEMTIITSSVNWGNEIRDPKLQAYFFKVLHTDTIFGKILDA